MGTLALITAALGIVALVIPRVWKTDEQKEFERKEKALREWDEFYDENQKH